MKSLILLPAFSLIILGMSSCQHEEEQLATVAGCRIAQSNQVVFTYSADGNRLQAINHPDGDFMFSYTSNGILKSIEDTRTGTSHVVETDGAGNITKALDYTFSYDSQNRLSHYEKLTGEPETYHRFEYSGDNLTNVYIKSLSYTPMGGPPSVDEILSQSSFIYDGNKTPWQGDKVLQWVVATSLLTPFEIADQASAYSQHNATGYSIFYGSDSKSARFTSSVSYTYGSNNTPEAYTATGSAGAYQCKFGYACGNN